MPKNNDTSAIFNKNTTTTTTNTNNNNNSYTLSKNSNSSLIDVVPSRDATEKEGPNDQSDHIEWKTLYHKPVINAKACLRMPFEMP